MKKFRLKTFSLFTLAALLSLPFGLLAQSTTAWTKSAGSADIDWGGKAVTDKDGNTYVLNSFTSEVQFDNSTKLMSKGEEDMFLMMLDAEGKIEWTKQFGSTAKDMGNDIAIDENGDVVIVGAFSGMVDFGNSNSLESKGGTDIFAVKLDNKGEAQWAISAGGSSDDEATTIEIDKSGKVYLGGQFESTDGFFGLKPMIALGGTDMFMARMDADAENIWLTTMGKSSNESVENLAVDAEGNMYVNGTFDGELILGDDTLNVDLGATFTTKISANGTMDWTKQSGSKTTKLDGGIVTDAQGNVYTAGSFEGTAMFGSKTLVSEGKKDMVILKQNAEGTIIWASQAGGSAQDMATSIALDAEGNVVVGGNFEGDASFGSMTETSAGATDNVVAKLDAEGKITWAMKSGGTLKDQVSSIDITSKGEIIVTGTFEGTSSFKREENSQGKSDMYVWKIEGEETNIRSNDLASIQLEVFPMPAANQLVLKGINQVDVSYINIHNLSGQLVMQLTQSDVVDQSIDISTLTNGVYMMNVNTDQGTVISEKIIKI